MGLVLVMADKVTVKADATELTKALAEYMQHTSKDLPEAINRTAIDVAFKANRAAKKASKGGITSLAKRSPKLFHALATIGANKYGPKPKGSGNKAMAEKIVSNRLAAIGYSKAIFLKMAQDLGKKISASLGRGLPGNSRGRKAKAGGFRTEATLEIEGVQQSHADDILSPAMKKGLAAATADKRKYIAKKIAERAEKNSGRKK